VQWLGAERILTGIVSPRDFCEAREAQQVLWLGEGLQLHMSGVWRELPAEILERAEDER
jgi:hypothetical protein